jgi:hypothetical protein
MESIVRDGDLDLANNLDPALRPGDRHYTLSDRLLHSPVLAVLLLPGFIVAGRTGALVLLALAGAVLAALIARRSGQLGLPDSRRRLVLLALILTYPLATFATQIWVELPGALMVAAIIVAAAGPASGRWVATAAAVLAATVKTRLGLITFPAAASAWWAGGRRSAVVGALVLLGAVVGSLGFGWIVLGHPFGFYRRLADLAPSDPLLALRVVGGLVFDPAGGLMFTAPLMLAGTLGAALLWRHGAAGERAVLVGGLLTVTALLHSGEWYGGGSPPARYLVPLLPAVALTWGVMLRTPRRWRRLTEVLVAPSCVMWWALITRPHFSINPGDGGWWLSSVLARRFGADVGQFVPSFLVPTAATVWLPPVAVVLVTAAVIAGSRSRPVLTAIVRCQTAVWLVLATVLAAAIVLRHDVVVEAEAPQVRRMGGSPVPPRGTFSRYAHRRGWKVTDRQGISVPLNLASGSEVWLEGWLEGPARRGARLEVEWADGDSDVLRVAGAARQGRVRLPSAPASGRQRLTVVLRAPAGGAAVFDRVVVER